MKNILAFKNYFVFAGLLLSASIFTLSGNAVDIQMHDTYFVISQIYIAGAILFWMVLQFAGYHLSEILNLQFVQALNWMHLLLIVLSILLFFLWLKLNSSNGRNYVLLDLYIDGSSPYSFLWIPALLLFFISMLISIVNIFIALVRRQK